MILSRAVRPGITFTTPVALFFLLAGCAGSPVAPTSYAPFGQTDLVVGDGTTAASGDTVTVDYTGWLYDPSQPDQKGLQFETSIGASNVTFTIGGGAVIAGWDQGVPGMNVGGIRRLVIPPSLGYGSSRHAIIPPNATLIFEIVLLEVQKAATE